MAALYENNFEAIAEHAYERFVEAAPCDSCIIRNRDSVELPVYGPAKILAFRDAQYGVMEFIYGPDFIPFEVTIRTFDPDDKSYRWVHPEYVLKHRELLTPSEAILDLGVDSIPDESWAETESLDDILRKIELIMSGQPHDKKVVIIIDLEKEYLDKLRDQAAKEGITFDEHLENIIRKTITKLDEKAARTKS